jgi:DNA repair protein RecN (Recombination protein N)
MIRSLSIENFALIDSVTIDFNSGFTVITGETGSGKSILLNALNLILGERANFSVIGNRGEKSTVEAEVDISGFGMEKFFSKNELDYFDQAIVRREIHKQGRSRAFINDTPVQLTLLKEFTSQLVHIHSQYNTLELKDASFQLKVLDVLAEAMEERDAFRRRISKYRDQLRTLEDKKKQLSESLTQSDYNTFQLNELKGLNLDQINYDEIQQEAKQGEHADEIKNGLGDLKTILSDEGGVKDQLNYIKSALSKKLSFDPVIERLYERITSVLIEVEDISEEAEQALEGVNFDPRKLDELIAQLDAFNRVMQKHGTQNQDELKELMSSLAQSSDNLGQLEHEIQSLTSDTEKELETLEQLAEAIHSKRLAAIPSIESAIKSALTELKLENTELSFRLTKEEDLNTFGHSKLEILFSPNVGVAPVPVHQAASGGELSRVMLALQNLMSSRIQLRTVLFDEIDTGVSGDVAQKMGTMLKKMGAEMQVIAITHLPQVAAKGGQHLKVLKQVVDGISTTSVRELSAEERVEETARLMSGDEISAAALENAKSLMQ